MQDHSKFNSLPPKKICCSLNASTETRKQRSDFVPEVREERLGVICSLTGCVGDALQRPWWCYLQGRNVVQARRIWRGSGQPGRCHPSGSDGRAGPPRGWCRSGPQTRAGQSLSCRLAWDIQSVYNLWPVSAGVHQGLWQSEHERLWNVDFLCWDKMNSHLTSRENTGIVLQLTTLRSCVLLHHGLGEYLTLIGWKAWINLWYTDTSGTPEVVPVQLPVHCSKPINYRLFLFSNS